MTPRTHHGSIVVDRSPEQVYALVLGRHPHRRVEPDLPRVPVGRRTRSGRSAAEAG